MVRSSSPCRHESLVELLGEELSESATAEVTEHLDSCPSCRAELERLAADPQVWRETQMVLRDPTLRDRVEEQRTSWHPSRSRSDGAKDDPKAISDLERGSSERLRDLLPTLAPPTHANSLGQLEHYEVRSVIGWGGMGVVLQAYDPTLGRPVAIKILHPHLAANAAARRRFAREARAAAAVNHPSVVPIHSVNAEHHPPYIVMSYIPGGSLQDRLDREGPLETADVLQIGIQIADALAAAHGQGLVHRDVKPGNILLDHGQNRVLLTDFGLAQALDDATMTSSGALAGTPQYMSPEQARGHALDHRSDLFSLGGVLYAMATGRPPFRAESTLAVLQKIGNADPKPVHEIIPESPLWMTQLIAMLHARDAADRPASAAHVAELLRQCLAHARRPHETALPKALPPVKLETTSAPDYWRMVLPAVLVLLCLASVWFATHLWSGGSGDANESESGARKRVVEIQTLQPQFSPLPLDVTRWEDGLDSGFEEFDQFIQQLD